MRRVPGSQRDLFEPAIGVVPLQADLRMKLTPLLQALLSEAAGVEARQGQLDDLGGKEAGDDQDHA
jgi:hypothetical protein